ncbi:MAG: SPOR domain-containing protein [Spirochaetaceae bacterium]
MRSKLLYIPVALTILTFLAPNLLAQENWEGSAIVGRYGEFPPGGLYAASNAFPINSVIEVTNPDTGRTQRLIVAQRAENAGVLLVVSQSAAEELGAPRNATFRVQVEPVEMPPLTSVSPSQDLPFHPDPDINPRAAVGDPNASILAPGALGAAESELPDISAVEEPEVEDAEEEAPAAEPEDRPEEPEGEAVAPPEPTPPSITEEPEAEEPVAEAEPEPEGPGEEELFPSAPEDELYADLATPERPEEEPLITELPIAPVEEATELEEGSLGPQFPNPVELSVTLPQPPDVEAPEATEPAPSRPEAGDPEGPLAMATPGEVTGPDMSEELPGPAERPDGPVTRIPLRITDEPKPERPEEDRIPRPSGEPGEEIVSLEPAEFRPPKPPEGEEEAEPAPEERREGVAEEPRIAEAPEPSEEEAPPEPERRPTEEPEEEAPPAVVREPEASPEELPLSETLPRDGYYLQVGAFRDAEGARAAADRLGEEFPVKVVPSAGEIYRVFVGPLEEDERGAVLYLVRARGYRDAFLRSSDG